MEIIISKPFIFKILFKNKFLSVVVKIFNSVVSYTQMENITNCEYLKTVRKTP